MSTVEVPDIGDFTDVPVVEVLVAVGDTVAPEDPLITLESDKASMDVPAPEAGVVEELLVDVGDTVNEGDAIVRLSGGEGEADQGADAGGAAEDAGFEGERSEAAETQARRSTGGDEGGRLVVIGSGPAGYAAAFRAADLGLEVVLIERYDSLGGVCLNVGCIPSKALLHAARVMSEVEEAEGFGISYGEPSIDLGRLDEWKGEVVAKLTGGLAGLAKRREVTVVTGEAEFVSASEVEVDGMKIDFDSAIIAAGSRPIALPDQPDDPRIVDSTGALDLEGPPESLLVVGGGIIGLEMATVYDALGTKVSVVELTNTLIPGCDRDLVRPLQKRIEGRYEAVMLGTEVTGIEPQERGIEVSFAGEGAPESERYEKVLVAVGRQANGDLLELGRSGVEVGDRGVIPVDSQQRTNVPNIFAVGDITGEPMLAHRGSYQGIVAAEVIAGRDVVYDARAIPSVAYTDPEVAWVGLTETAARERGVEFEKGSFPWQASGRALALERPDGLTKVLTEPGTGRILGAGMVGVGADELVAEVCHAIEMGADATDLGLTVHPHPTRSETVRFAAEVAEGVAIDIYAPKR